MKQHSNLVQPNLIPDRTSEDCKYIWLLFDAVYDTPDEMRRGYVETKEEADNWVMHSPALRSWHQILRCHIPGEKCSPLCGEVKIKALEVTDAQ